MNLIKLEMKKNSPQPLFLSSRHYSGSSFSNGRTDGLCS